MAGVERDGMQVRQQLGLVGGTVLEVDDHPVEAGPTADLGRGRRAEPEECPEQGLAAKDPGTQVGEAGNRARVSVGLSSAE